MAPRSKFLVVVDDADRPVLEEGCSGFIDFLLESGVTLGRMYSEAKCAVSRVDLQTGRLPSRHGVTQVPSKGGNMPDTETTIAQHPRIAPRPTGYFGKWHKNDEADVGAPNRFGYDHFSGHMENLSRRTAPWDGHFVWPNTVNGAGEIAREEYSTTAIVDDFLNWLDLQGARSVFAVLSFSALHSPYSAPPGSSLPTPTPGSGVDPRPWWEAMSTHLGQELLRMIGAMRTGQRDGADWIFVSDNGAPQALGGGKGSVSESGIRVPAWIRSPECVGPGREWCKPTQLTDVYRTFATSGGDDSIDMMPLVRSAIVTGARDCALAENVVLGTDPDPDVRTIAGIEERYKGVQVAGGAWELYDVLDDPDELTDLVPGGLTTEQSDALARIQAAWAAIPS